MEQTFAEKIPVAKRRKIQMWSIAANCLGSLSEVMLDSSVFLISYVALLGGNESLTMLLAAATGFVALSLQIPCGILAGKIGLKNTMYLSCSIGCASCLLMALAAFAGGGAEYMAVGLCFVYCLARTTFSASWFPIVDSFVAPSERGSYFGILRFVYTIFAALFFFLVGRAMGEKPPIWAFQILIALCAVLQFSRAVFVYFVKLEPADKKRDGIIEPLRAALGNSYLTTFSVYLLLVGIVAFLIQPLTYVYLKQSLGFGVSTVQTIATIGMAGCIFGYLIFGRLLKIIGARGMVFLIHLSYVAIPAALFFCGRGTPNLLYVVGAIMFFNCAILASFNCFASAEMYSMASPDNRIMSLALCNTFFSGGRMFGGFLSSVVLASGILAPHWQSWGMSFSAMQTIYAFAFAFATFFLIFLFVVPSVNPSRANDYYNPPSKRG